MKPLQTPSDATMRNDIPVINGLEHLADDYDAYIFDIWGVIHNGVRAYPGVARCLKELKSRGKHICMLSNSPNRAHYMPQQLESMGITPDLYDHVITSGESVWRDIKKHEGEYIYCFYDDENPTSIDGINVHRVYDPYDADVALISHLPRDAEIKHYQNIMQILLDKGAPVICANPDKVVDVGGTLYPCAGGVADAFEAMGGDVHWHGKPHAPVYEWALDLMGNPPKDRVLAVGDSIRTDVTGAVNFGMDVLWNAVGIHWHEISYQNEINQDKIKQAMQGLSHYPKAILNGLAW